MSTLIITGSTYPIRETLKKFGGRYSDGAWVIDSEKWAKIVSCYGGDPTTGNKRDREVKAAIAGCEARENTVSTPSGAVISSKYTQGERAEMRRSGIDTDCDDHDLI